jgi:hypothetical protein
MRKTEIILLVIIFVSSIFILNGFTEITNTIAIFSSMLLAILYFLFGFLLLNNKHIYKIFSKSTYQDLNALKITMGAILGIILSNILSGLLFKLMLWPGAKAMLMVSGLTIILGLMFLVIVQLVTRKIEFIHNLRYFIWMVCFAIMYFMPYRTLIEARYLEKYPDYSNAMSRYYENNTDENKHIFDVENQKYQDQKMREFGVRKNN